MVQRSLARLGWPMTILALVVALLALGEVGIGVHLAAVHSTTPSAAASAQARPNQTGHPCNHGFYVSQAAHAKKGGGYVSGIAQSKLGKQGGCTAPLPAKAPSNTKNGD
jgi:hypothetical protein